MIDKLQKLEKEQIEEIDFTNYPPKDVVSLTEVRSCYEFVRLHSNGRLDIQPDFQRSLVWENPNKTRFIDSLYKQLPIPSLCICLDYPTDQRIVIDGLQRISTIISFLTDDSYRLSKLEDVDPKLSGKSVKEIKKDNPEIIRRIEDLSIPVTVLRCDLSKWEDNEFLFMIFHRLNSGGKKLNNQEIRNCIYSGDFNDFLKKTANDRNFKELTNYLKEKPKRFNNEEMLLRVLAFYDRLQSYKGSLSKFLNKYMLKYRNPARAFLDERRELLIRAFSIINENIFNGFYVVDSKVGRTVFEGLLYGIIMNLDFLDSLSEQDIQFRYDCFINLEEFSPEELQAGLSSTDKVITRLRAAAHCFSQGYVA